MASHNPWPPSAFPPGTRVRVIRASDWNGPWAQEFEGVIDEAVVPELVTHAIAAPGELSYLVAFLELQFDSDGDGPFRKAMIWARYLQPIAD
jgi:hypothetical protein